ncbi:ribonuclease [Candidatus Omnitrophus magneticus]|uniref:Ribonuclease Y n=1 Tax=Candidatus Omnitrophus magneticus TaxID=1609969 RepID=A0A0F0CS73_9BACT|nr:ribonuclease [Candidatus Omnitrophus magneticus]
MGHIGFALLGGFFFFIFGYILRKYTAKRKIKYAEDHAKTIISQAKIEAERCKRESTIEAKDILLKMRTDFEEEAKTHRKEMLVLEKRLVQKEETLDKRVELLEQKERELKKMDEDLKVGKVKLEKHSEELTKIITMEKDRLEEISGMTKDQAKEMLVKRMEEDARIEAALTIRKIQEETKDKADKEARKIVGLAIQKCAVDHTVDTTVSVVHLPSEEIKGRIIGREGRNIRALEMATGVDVIIDDTPEAVIISGFDKFRREIAKKSLEILIEDGRIHPGRIEEIVEKTKKEMEAEIKEEGENVLLEMGIHGMHPEIVRLLGRLKYRTSYGQNVLQHSKETAYLMAGMAGELKLDVRLAKRIGVLHDIGKAVSHEIEGTHSKIGAELAKKYGEAEIVVHAIEAHHSDIEPRTLLAVLIQAADAISASRPGARKETLEAYIKRMEDLETIANSFPGVDKTYAIQAGREVRIIVQPEKINDANIPVMALDIKKKIETELQYPGQIKVVVIREVRSIEYAK